MYEMFSSRATFQKFPSRRLPAAEKRPRLRPSTIEFSSLTEGLVTECHHRALATAVATSGINTLFGPGPRSEVSELKPYAESDLTIFRSLKTMVEQASEDEVGLPRLTSYLEMLADGQQAFEAYSLEVHTLGEQRAGIVHQRQLKAAWKNACCFAILALDELEGAVSPGLPEAYLQNHKVLNSLLSSAAHGFKPCVDASNQLFMPPLPQQRRWPRHSVLQTCQVTIDGRTATAFVRDVSAGGLGLDHMPSLARGKCIAVELECGRLLTGTVAWCRETSAGMQFCKPLLPSDPLIRG